MPEGTELSPLAQADPSRFYFHMPWVPKPLLVRRARQYAHLLAAQTASTAARLTGHDLVPSTELTWRRKKRALGPLRIGRRTYYLIPSEGVGNGGRV